MVNAEKNCLKHRNGNKDRAVYPIVFIDAIHFSVRDEHIVKKIAIYNILGIIDEGRKKVLRIIVGENESAKYWPVY